MRMSESSARGGTSNGHLLEVRQVSRRFGGFVAVDNVTLNVSEGGKSWGLPVPTVPERVLSST